MVWPLPEARKQLDLILCKTVETNLSSKFLSEKSTENEMEDNIKEDEKEPLQELTLTLTLTINLTLTLIPQANYFTEIQLKPFATVLGAALTAP